MVLYHIAAKFKKREGQEKKEENTAPLSSSERDVLIVWRPLSFRQVKGLRIFLCATADQPQQDDESFTKDNVSTGAENSTANDVPANLHDGPDGVTQSAPAVALESPSAERDRRSSTLFPRREGHSINASFVS